MRSPPSHVVQASVNLTEQVLASTILVVDDMELMRQLIGICLSKSGYRSIVYATDGDEALDMIRANSPDLVILDINMPRLGGLDVCRALRQDPATKDLPVLVQSASEAPQERVEVFRAGATDFVSKPINQPELIARVTMHLENKHLIHNLTNFEKHIRAELAQAREMQHSLLPDEPSLNEWNKIYSLDINAVYKASFELGGDLWGCWPIDEDRFGLFVFDMSGHGVSAALNTFQAHAVMARLVSDRDDPAEFMTKLNKHLCDNLPLGQFATMVYMVVNKKTGNLVYAGAGAPRPFILSETKGLRQLDSTGLPVGISSSPNYENKYDCLAPNELLFAYSDVLIESQDASGSFLGEEGFADFIVSIYNKEGSSAFASKVVEQFVQRFGANLPDDLTAVALYRREESNDHD